MTRGRLFSCLKSEGAAERSLDVFDWLDGAGYPTRDCFVLSRLMSMLGSTGALHLFERLTGAGLAPDLACFNAAINFAGAGPGCPKTVKTYYQCPTPQTSTSRVRAPRPCDPSAINPKTLGGLAPVLACFCVAISYAGAGPGCPKTLQSVP